MTFNYEADGAFVRERYKDQRYVRLEKEKIRQSQIFATGDLGIRMDTHLDLPDDCDVTGAEVISEAYRLSPAALRQLVLYRFTPGATLAGFKHLVAAMFPEYRADDVWDALGYKTQEPKVEAEDIGEAYPFHSLGTGKQAMEESLWKAIGKMAEGVAGEFQKFQNALGPDDMSDAQHFAIEAEKTRLEQLRRGWKYCTNPANWPYNFTVKESS
jgi:hypothetical protein